MALTPAVEAQLCAAVKDMLLAQRYVDEWKVAGVVRWMQENKSLTIAEPLLAQYFDRVDQNMTAEAPGILYDAVQSAVHRDY